jgi:hypothetical protein
MHFLADGLIHIALLDSTGATILDTTLPTLGSSSGGGGGGTVDPTSIMSTGDLKVKYSTGVLAGFVRTNGLTIGNATSGASERANSDTQALFIFLYNCGDATLTVSGGRSGNAISDYNAGKTITLPNYSGRALAALDDQGAGAQGILTAPYFGVAATVLGAAGGFQNATIGIAFLPLITSTNPTQAISVANASQAISVANASQAISVANASQAISVANASQNITASGLNSISASGNNAISVTSSTNRFVSNTGIIDSSTSGGGTQGVFHDVNAVSMGSVTSTNAVQAISVANASQNISVSGVNNITASGTNSISASGTNSISASGTNSISASGANAITVTSTGTLGLPLPTVSPMKLATIYLKL